MPSPLAAILVTGMAPSARQHAIGGLIGFKPDAQRWIVIRSGVVAHHASSGTPPADIEFAVLPPGCLCCTGLLPFKVGLTRLLRRLSNWAPSLLIIDAGTESHAASVRTQLLKPDFARLLRLETTIAAIDARTIGVAPLALRQALGSQCAAADLVVCEPATGMDSGSAYADFCSEFGITAPLLAAADLARAVRPDLTKGTINA